MFKYQLFDYILTFYSLLYCILSIYSIQNCAGVYVIYGFHFRIVKGELTLFSIRGGIGSDRIKTH